MERKETKSVITSPSGKKRFWQLYEGWGEIAQSFGEEGWFHFERPDGLFIDSLVQDGTWKGKVSSDPEYNEINLNGDWVFDLMLTKETIERRLKLISFESERKS